MSGGGFGGAGVPPAPVAPTAADAAAATSRSFIRGSSLLLAGRFIAILLNLAVQVLTVRYLSKDDYGAFAWALGVASIGSSMVLLGMGKGVPRFVPLYHEKGDNRRAFGTMVLAAGSVVGLGAAVVVLLYALEHVFAGAGLADPLSLSVLLILIVLVPLNALDNLLQKIAAVFVGARAIFFRRHLLGPGLKLAAVLVVMGAAGDAHLLAWGYVVGALLGIWLYAWVLVRYWRSEGLLGFLRPGRFELPARELFGFSLPLLSSDVAMVARGSLAILMLEFFRSTAAVAEYRAVLPVAGLNMIVFEAFAFLFVPLASRMYARQDRAGIGDLFWTTSIWISVLSFPVLALTCALARPVTVFLFGAEYGSSGVVLAVLAVGHYVHAALGFNAETLRVHGKVRFIVVSDGLAAGAAVVLGLLLIPRYGALGAAVGMTSVLVLQNLVNHAGLHLSRTGVDLVDRRFVVAHAVMLGVLAGLAAFQWTLEPPLHVGIAAAAIASLVVIRLTRRVVDPQDAFPELLRVPLLRRLLT